jgi:hypothetical protein
LGHLEEEVVADTCTLKKEPAKEEAKVKKILGIQAPVNEGELILHALFYHPRA